MLLISMLLVMNTLVMIINLMSLACIPAGNRENLKAAGGEQVWSAI